MESEKTKLKAECPTFSPRVRALGLIDAFDNSLLLRSVRERMDRVPQAAARRITLPLMATLRARVAPADCGIEY